MRRRLEFHEVLCNLLGSRNVYFQPPGTISIQYPCIIYSLQKVNSEYGDNFGYHKRDCYSVTYIDKNPDSIIPDQIGDLELSSFERYYVAENLHHNIYNVYY